MNQPQEGLELPDQLGTLLQAARHRQQIPSALYEFHTVHHQLSQPTAFVFWGDWHLGAQGTDYELFERDLRALAYAKSLLNDQLQVIGMGDYIDGYLPTGTPKNPVQMMSPREQRKAALQALRLVKPLLVLEGDHDEWHTRQDVEYAWLYEGTKHLDINYAQWGAEIQITLDGRYQPLKLLARHRFKGSRYTDVLKPHKNLHLEHGPAEIAVLAHVHSNPGVYKTHAKRKSEGTFLAVQSGTYKLVDDYAKKLGFIESDYGVPAIIVYPDGRLASFDRFQDSLDELV